MRTAALLFFPTTFSESLAARVKLEEEKLAEIVCWRFNIIERGGRQLKELLVKSNIFSKEKCGRSECGSCSQGKKLQDCRRRGILYLTSCTECLGADGKQRAKYVGESARSGMERYGEHLEDAKKGKGL